MYKSHHDTVVQSLTYFHQGLVFYYNPIYVDLYFPLHSLMTKLIPLRRTLPLPSLCRVFLKFCPLRILSNLPSSLPTSVPRLRLVFLSFLFEYPHIFYSYNLRLITHNHSDLVSLLPMSDTYFNTKTRYPLFFSKIFSVITKIKTPHTLVSSLFISTIF